MSILQEVENAFRAKVVDEMLLRNDKLLSMLCRVADELSDPMGERWCDSPTRDRELIENLLKDVEKLLEEL